MSVITLSRQLGTEGLAVARRAAEILEYKCLDRAIVTEVAKMADLPLREVERHDERGQSLWERLLTSVFGNPPDILPVSPLAGGHGEMMVAPTLMEELEQSKIPDQEDIISLIEQVIKTAAQRGDVVIVGRGSQALLADCPDALHVRLVAPLEFRIQGIAEQKGCGPEEAMALVQRTDRGRERYIRQHYKADWEDAGLYHMIVNTGRTGVELAAKLIADAAARLSSDAPQRGTPQRTDTSRAPV